MSFLTNFKCDVFLSYAHIDNGMPTADEEGWVLKFYKDFKFKLCTRVGTNDVEVWCDYEMRKNHAFNEKIQEKVKGAAIFFCFTSNGFLNSEYCCDKELNLFFRTCRSSGFGSRVNGKSRIFNIQLYNIPYQRWPVEFEGVNGYKMYKDSRFLSEERLSDIGEPVPHRSKEYEESMSNIVSDAYAIIMEMKASKPEPTAIKPAIVFLGKVADTLRNKKLQVVKELQAIDIQVDTEEFPPPYTREDHKAAVRQKLAGVETCIHLFDDIPGDKIENSYPYTFLQEQVLIAKELGKKQLIFIPQELQIDTLDSQYRSFLEELDQRNTQSLHSMIKESSVSGIVRIIKEQLSAPPPPPDANAVFLDFSKADMLHAIELANKMSAEGKRIFFCTPETSLFESIQHFAEVLKQVSVVILLCIEAGTDWFFGRLRELVKAIQTEECNVSKIILYRKDQSVEIEKGLMKTFPL